MAPRQIPAIWTLAQMQSHLLREAHFIKSLRVSEALQHTIITVPKAFPAISMLAETTRIGHTCPTWTESGLCNKSKGKVKQYKKKLTERTTLLLFKTKFIRNAITFQRWQQHACLLWRQPVGLSKTDISFRESSSRISDFLLSLSFPPFKVPILPNTQFLREKLSAEFKIQEFNSRVKVFFFFLSFC